MQLLPAPSPELHLAICNYSAIHIFLDTSCSIMQERELHPGLSLTGHVDNAFYNGVYDIRHKLPATETTFEDIEDFHETAHLLQFCCRIAGASCVTK
jgi:hypothetical protein